MHTVYSEAILARISVHLIICQIKTFTTVTADFCEACRLLSQLEHHLATLNTASS